MKIKATEEQGYYTLNGMAITTGKVYDAELLPSSGGTIIVVGDNGGKVYILPDECVLEEE